ncbi:MAG: hypothetical protein ACYDG6_04305 [Thermincolia bacterium]
MRRMDQSKVVMILFGIAFLSALGAYILSPAGEAVAKQLGYQGQFASYIANQTAGAGGCGMKDANGGACNMSANGGSCGMQGNGSASGSSAPADLDKKALEEYRAETGNTDVQAKVEDRGCHVQIDLYDSNGQIVRSYGYQGGPLYVIN